MMAISKEDYLGDEQYWVSEWLIRHGGSFSSSLGHALAHADITNAVKIKRTWPEIWQEALEATKNRRRNDQFY